MRILRRGSTRSKERMQRAMGSWQLGLPLRGSEIVHHMNGDWQDHHPDNWAVVSSRRGNMLLHHYLWRQ